MSDNYCRLIIGIVGSFVLLGITSLNLGGVIIHLQNEYNRIKNL